MCADSIKQEVKTALANVGLPTEFAFDKVKLAEIMSHDKKSQGDKISVVKCDEIGSFYFEEMTIKDIINLI